MQNVIINGEQTGIKAEGLTKVAELIELIKGSIDPDHMITGVLLDGHELADHEWSASLNQYETSILEIETGTPQEFVSSRLAHSAAVVQNCYMEFRDARKRFHDGQMQEGNQRLLQGVNTLQAFFEWYGTLIELCPVEERERYGMGGRVEAIGEVCKRICQQQLYQSWWALGETIQQELEPKLDDLEDFCRRFAKQQ